MDIHKPLTKADIDHINTVVRLNPVTAAQKQQLAQVTGLTISTVRRWFSIGASRPVNLLPQSMIGHIPVQIPMTVTDGMKYRVFAGIVIVGGIGADIFHGKEYEREGILHNLIAAITLLDNILTDKFHQLGLFEIQFVMSGEEFVYFHRYCSPVEGEYISLIGILDSGDEDNEEWEGDEAWEEGEEE